MRFALRLALFAVLTAVVYATLSAGMALVSVGGKPLFEGLTRLMLRPVEAGNVRPRMAEWEALQARGLPLDVLFVGSSLTYRGIDARHFAARGYRAFALGLPSQTPLNYAPLISHLRSADSILVAFEAHPDLLASDGTEAFFAYAVNQPLDAQTLRMAASVRSARALNLLAALAWYRAAHPYGTQPPLPDASGDQYVGAGFTRRTRLLTADSLRVLLARPPSAGALRSRQVAALTRSVQHVRQVGGRAVLVVPPVNAAHLRRRPFLTAQLDTLAAFARQWNAPLLDLSRLPLDSLADFSDLTHLSPQGVARYNAALLDSLAQRNLL